MKFDYISPRVKGDLPVLLQNKLSRLLLEMGCAPDNHHIGSGMGGNPSQHLILMDMRHILGGDLYDAIRMDYDNREVIWGYRWFQDRCMKTIRLELNKQFIALANYYYSNRAVSLAETLAARNIRSYVLENKNLFPNLWAAVIDRKFVPGLSTSEQIILATAECQALAHDLDVGVKTNIDYVGELLSQLDAEAVLFAVRNQIKIDRLVKFNLDEQPSWKDTLEKVSSFINSK